MCSAQSQFTQTLLLFVSPHTLASCLFPVSSHPTQSQTQSGRRYIPQLTRFYTAIGPGTLIDLIKESLDALGVHYKDAPVVAGSRAVHRLRVGGHDRRRIVFKGWIELEVFTRMQVSGAFCLMLRDVARHVSLGVGCFWLTQFRFFFFFVRTGQSDLLETILEGVDPFAGGVSTCVAKAR